METHKKFKIEQNAIRIYVVFTGIMLTIYCGLLCFDVRHFFAEWLCLTGAYVVLCGGAWMFKLCWISWAFILYTYVVRICIMLYGEGFWQDPAIHHMAHCVMFGFGLFLTMCFFVRFRKYTKQIIPDKNDEQ